MLVFHQLLSLLDPVSCWFSLGVLGRIYKFTLFGLPCLSVVVSKICIQIGGRHSFGGGALVLNDGLQELGVNPTGRTISKIIFA